MSEAGKSRTKRVVLGVLLGVLALACWTTYRKLKPFFASPTSKVLTRAPIVDAGPLAGFRLEPAFAARFVRPLFVTQAPAGEWFYVVEQRGRILRLKAGAEASEEVLALSVSRRGNEEGLLGLAFHPRFPSDRRMFVYYSVEDDGGGATGPGLSRVSSWLLDANGLATPGSEKVVLEVQQPYRNHNGGMLAFGPDGMLYVGLGDGGWGGDPEDHGLNPGTLLGSILRLDVDAADEGKGYRIPEDNPLAGRDDARGEVWAWGLRNPWRFSFDRQTGELWAGDVGQGAWEEVHIIEAGKSHGWAGYEGFEVYDERSARAQGSVKPVAAYARGEGISITGGYVYRGKAHPALVGRYLYADFGSGAVWALGRGDAPPDRDRHPTASGYEVAKILQASAVSSFGEDRAGELYVASFDGTVYRLTR